MAAAASFCHAHLASWTTHSLQSNRYYHVSSPDTLLFKRAKRCCRKKGFSAIRLVASHPGIDFTDPDWKTKYLKDFELRFKLPHLRDVLDLKPMPTTFSLMNSSSDARVGNCFRFVKNEENVVGNADAPKVRKNDYVNEDDRTLLKVIKYSSPTSAGAECIDANCTWVEQWYNFPLPPILR